MFKIEWLDYHFSDMDFGFSRAFEVTVETQMLRQQFKGNVFVTADPYKGKAKGAVVCHQLGVMPVINLTTAFGVNGQERPYVAEYALLDLEGQIRSRVNKLIRIQKI